MSNLQAQAQQIIDRMVSEGKERGIQLAVYLDGELIVNACAGIADCRTGEPVTLETLFPVFSTTKGVAATLVHMLVERGRLSYETPIAEVWPEFGCNGKDRITLRQALCHASGIPQMPLGIGFAELVDWDRMCTEIAQLRPLWKPGSRIEYHAMTFGWIVGEVLRRADGRPFAQMLNEEICQPLGIKDLYVGIPDDLQEPIAWLEEYTVKPAEVDPPLHQSVPSWIGPLDAMMNREDVRRACIPASNGIMSAHAIARHYAALLPGGVDGVQLLPPSRLQLASAPQIREEPEDSEPQPNWGLGYQLGGAGSIFGNSASAFGHCGYGGSVGFADPQRNLAVGLTKNLFSESLPERTVMDALLRSIGRQLTDRH